MPIDIRDHQDKLLFVFAGDSVVGAQLNCRDLRGADLHGRDLRGANLQGANLRGANLGGCDMRGAYFTSADLENADMRGALLAQYFFGANLKGVLFDGCVICWSSRDVVSELLCRAADTPERAAYAVRGVPHAAGTAFDSRCWTDLYAEHHSEAGWAIGVLAQYVRDGDDAPSFLRDAAQGVMLVSATPHA